MADRPANGTDPAPAGAPDLRKLVHFVAVAETLNFTRAAERLQMAQQALSGSIQRLERELGVALFDRGTRHVALTDAGRVLAAEAPDLLAAAHGAWARTRRAGRTDRPRALRVGHTPALAGEEVAELLGDARRRHPETAVTIVPAWPSELAPSVRAGDLDLAFGRRLGDADGVRRRDVTVDRQPLRVALTGDDPLAGSPQLELAALDGYALVVWAAPETSGYTRFLVDLCRDAGLDPRLRVSDLQGAPPVTHVQAPGEFALVTAPVGPAALGRVVVVALEPATPAPVSVLLSAADAAVNGLVAEVVDGLCGSPDAGS